MPELAEVAWYSREWDAGKNDRIAEVHLHPASRIFRGEDCTVLESALTGAAYLGAQTHGKNLLFRFSTGWLGGHLGMTGEILCLPASHAPEKHDHLVLRQRARCLVFRDPRQFGRIRFHAGTAPPEWWLSLPPQVHERAFSVSFLTNWLQRHARSPLKAALLDQSAFPGIGNWMADEIVWRLRIPPSTPCGSVPAAALHREVRYVARRAMEIIGKDWSDPPASWLFLHRWKDGGHCPACQSALTREDLRGRTTCWCPVCQA